MPTNPYAMVPKETRDFVRSLVKDHGWRFEPPPGRGYPKLKCPCGKHLRTVHISPSDPNYLKNLQKWVQRQSCQADAWD